MFFHTIYIQYIHTFFHNTIGHQVALCEEPGNQEPVEIPWNWKIRSLRQILAGHGNSFLVTKKGVVYSWGHGTYITTCVHTQLLHTCIHNCICIYIDRYITLYVYTYITTYVYTYITTYVHTYITTYVYTYITTYVYTYITTCVYTYIDR